LPGAARLRRLDRDLVEVVRRAIDLNPRRRYRDAGVMLEAFRRAKTRALRKRAKRSPRTKRNGDTVRGSKRKTR
jgi:hypothetical protein